MTFFCLECLNLWRDNKEESLSAQAVVPHPMCNNHKLTLEKFQKNDLIPIGQFGPIKKLFIEPDLSKGIHIVYSLIEPNKALQLESEIGGRGVSYSIDEARKIACVEALERLSVFIAQGSKSHISNLEIEPGRAQPWTVNYSDFGAYKDNGSIPEGIKIASAAHHSHNHCFTNVVAELIEHNLSAFAIPKLYPVDEMNSVGKTLFKSFGEVLKPEFSCIKSKTGHWIVECRVIDFSYSSTFNTPASGIGVAKEKQIATNKSILECYSDTFRRIEDRTDPALASWIDTPVEKRKDFSIKLTNARNSLTEYFRLECMIAWIE